MPTNNRSVTQFGTQLEKIRRAQKNIEAARSVDNNIYEATKEEINRTIELIHGEKEYVKDSNFIIKNKNPWERKTVTGNINEVTEKLADSRMINFFNVVAGKTQNAEEFMGITLKNLKSVTTSNQVGNANESLASWKQSVEYFKKNVEGKGNLFVWDLETTGGKDLNGIWRPDSITEFAMSKFNYATNETTKTNVLIGMSGGKEDKKLLEDITRAIENGTIDSNERLKVTAMRLSKYGDEAFTMKKIKEQGYYVATSFPDTEKHNWKDIEAIKRGWDNLVKVGQDTDIIDGIPADKRAVALAVNELNRSIKAGNSTLVDYNGSMHDMSILNSELLKWSKKNPLINNLFDNGVVGADVNSEQWLDVFGGVKLSTNYNSLSYLYPGQDIRNIEKLRGQEDIVKMHYPKAFKEAGLKPHMGEDDVTALSWLLTKPSEITPNGETFLDYINNSLKKANETTTNEMNLIPNQHIVRAKKSVGKRNDGKNYFNFAHSKSTGEIFTSDNHVINGINVVKENFSTGYGVNKGQMYDVLNIDKFELTEDVRHMLGDLAPEYSGQNIYRVQLGMMVHNDYKDMRLDDLVQNLVFKTEKEMNAFLASNFDVVAEHTENGFKIVDGMESYFNRIELAKDNDASTIIKDVNGHAVTDTDLVNRQILADNEKRAVSRADNAMFKENSYKKISKALNLKAELQEELGVDNITGKDMLAIMSGRAAKGETVIPLNNSQIMKANEIIAATLSYEKDNTKKLLRSTIDNTSIGIEMISTHEKVLNNIINTLNGMDGFKEQSGGYKQELFSRVLKEVKYSAAKEVYEDTFGQDKLMLGDKRLQGTLKEFENIFEINYSKLIKGNPIKYEDFANPAEYANVLKLDLSNSNSAYNLINKAVELVHGNNIEKNSVYEQHAMIKMFSMLNSNNEDLSNTESFKQFIKKYRTNKKGELLPGAHQYEIAEAIIGGMKELKESDVTNGIINVEHAFMKAIEGNDDFIKVLNSDKVQESIPNIIKKISKDFKYVELDSKESTMRLAEELVSKYYMPTLSKDADDVTKTLYKNAKTDITKRVNDVLSAVTRIKDTTLSVQEDGGLIAYRKGKILEIDKYLPKVKLNGPADTLYTELGSMNIQLWNELTFDVDGKSVKGGARSSLGSMNDFNVTRQVKRAMENDGADEAFNVLEYNLRRTAREIRQKPTINGFGGNDIDSNSFVDLSNIKNVLLEMVNENGSLNYLVNDKEFADKDLIKTLQKDLKYYIDNEKNLDELGAETKRYISKNITFLLDTIRNQGNVSNDFNFLSQDLGFTGTDKRASNLIALKGYRASNSALDIFDNGQRPTITQAGNAYQLEVDRILEANKTHNMNLGAGNVISVANIDKRNMREYSGLSKTTTDVMMDITYVDTNSLNVIFENNFERVIEANSVDQNTRKQTIKTYRHLQNSVNVFEQERVMDARVHEAAFGLRTAQTQKLSKNYDVVSVLEELNDIDYDKQVDAVLKLRGNFTVADGEIIYNPSHGRLIKRGESAIKWKGFADMQSSFTSKVDNGVFNYNFYESDGTKLSTSAINRIIKENKEVFEGKKSQPEMIRALEDLLTSKNIKGQYAIEDISAYGYKKTMTAAEKGMTNIVYASVGSHNKQVKRFFQETDKWDMVNSLVLTNEALEAIYYENEDLSKRALKSAGLKSLDDLKDAIKVERLSHSKLLFDEILEKKTQMLANDNIIGHNNIGQMYQATLSKAINSLSKKMGNQNDAVDYIANLINSDEQYQFLGNLNLNATSRDKSFTPIRFSSKDGRLVIDDKFSTNDVISKLNSDRFNNLIKNIDSELDGLDETDRLVAHNIYIANKNGVFEKKKEFIGSFSTTTKDIKVLNANGELEDVYDAKVVLTTNTRENVKYVRDAETQTGTDYQFFELKKNSKELKKQKIDLQAKITKTKDPIEAESLKLQLLELSDTIDDVDEKIAVYSGAVKSMTLTDQDLSVLERVSMTEAHAEKINDLIESGDISARYFKSSAAFEGQIEQKDGKFVFKNVGERSLKGYTDQLKSYQFYDRYSEDLLTEDMLEKKSHLKDIYAYAQKHNRKLGVNSAEDLYQLQLADKGARFNAGLDSMGELLSHKTNGYIPKDIRDINFGVDEVPTTNYLVDLGENFDAANRYLAVPGLGSKVGDEDIRTEAQKKLYNLQQSVLDIQNLNEGDPEEKAKLISKALTAREEAVDAVTRHIYGKNGAMHTVSKLEADAVSYRLKASGIITNAMTSDMKWMANSVGLEISSAGSFTDNSFINGRSITDWEKDGEAFFKYKYVSREQMERMGYFSDEKLTSFGFLKDGVSREDAVKEMEEFLSTYGTYDISVRYPVTKNESDSVNRLFLGKNLANNETKVSVATTLGYNGDFDGDSTSAQLLEIEGSNGKFYDGGAYELAKKKAKDADAHNVRRYVIDNDLMDEEAYDKWRAIERGMITEAVDNNRMTQEQALKKIQKDFIKNQNVSNVSEAVLVPGGKSVLGKNAYAGRSGMPSLDEFNHIENMSNEILSKAAKLQGKEAPNIRDGNSAQLLDEALTTLQGNVSDEELFKYEQIAIKRATIDKYSQEVMAKTGLATTGAVNLSLTSAKMAAFLSETDSKDIAFTNYVWSVLDTAEQGVISSKKLDASNVYDDTRLTEFKDTMREIFDGKSKRADGKSLNKLSSWLDDNGDGIFKTAYENMGHLILNQNQLDKLNEMDADKRIVEGSKMMKDAFINKISDMSSDKLVGSYMSSVDSMGRNGRTVANKWWNHEIGMAAAQGNSLSSVTQGIMGYGDEAQLKEYFAKRSQEELSALQHDIAKESLSSSTTKQAVNSAVEGYVKSSDMVTPKAGGKLGMLAIGVATGLLVGGYASGNPLNDKSAQQVSEEQTQPQETMSIPDFMEKESGYVTGNSQQGYIINIRADTKKGKKHMQNIMSKAAEATVGGAVSVNMNIRNISNRGITDSDIENYINRHF